MTVSQINSSNSPQVNKIKIIKILINALKIQITVLINARTHRLINDKIETETNINGLNKT
jgi:hypothetical protein